MPKISMRSAAEMSKRGLVGFLRRDAGREVLRRELLRDELLREELLRDPLDRVERPLVLFLADELRVLLRLVIAQMFSLVTIYYTIMQPKRAIDGAWAF